VLDKAMDYVSIMKTMHFDAWVVGALAPTMRTATAKRAPRAP
jgi:hypothetical protein